MLALHGAAAADGYDDCEGDILSGSAPSSATRCRWAPSSTSTATSPRRWCARRRFWWPTRNIPTPTSAERAEELFTLVADAAEGRTRPVMAVRLPDDRHLPSPPSSRCATLSTGCTRWREETASSRFPSATPFPGRCRRCRGQDPGGGRRRPGKAARSRAGWGRSFSGSARRRGRASSAWTRRSTGRSHRGRAGGDRRRLGQFGGGAPGNSTFFIRRMRGRGIQNVASGYYWDPTAVRFCLEAGVGASFALRIGGKCGVSSGDPLDLVRHREGGGRQCDPAFRQIAGRSGLARLGIRRGARPGADLSAHPGLPPRGHDQARPRPHDAEDRDRQVDPAFPRRLRPDREGGPLRGTAGNSWPRFRQDSLHQAGASLLAAGGRPVQGGFRGQATLRRGSVRRRR